MPPHFWTRLMAHQQYHPALLASTGVEPNQQQPLTQSNTRTRTGRGSSDYRAARWNALRFSSSHIYNIPQHKDLFIFILAILHSVNKRYIYIYTYLHSVILLTIWFDTVLFFLVVLCNGNIVIANVILKGRTGNCVSLLTLLLILAHLVNYCSL